MGNFTKRLTHKLRYKYRLIIYNDDTFEEIISYRLNRLNVVSLLGSMIVLACASLYLLIAYTPLKVYVIPDFPKAEERRAIIENKLKSDSLQNQLRLHKQYLRNIQTILRGDDPDSTYNHNKEPQSKVGDVVFEKSKEDSLFRMQIEEEEAYSLTFAENQKQKGQLSTLDFFPPVRGLVTNPYHNGSKHYGIDIVAANDAVIHSTLDGVVVFANWTVETGYVIHIQHEFDLLSVYKHNSKLLKNIGDHVQAGDAIAVIGNTGKISTGPHLHFELWQKGQALNAEEYIVFQ